MFQFTQEVNLRDKESSMTTLSRFIRKTSPICQLLMKKKTTVVHFYYNFWPFSIILIQKSLIAAISLEEKN